MKKIYSIFILAGLSGLLACSRDEGSARPADNGDAQTVSLSFKAVLPEDGLTTKTILGEPEEGHRKVSWTEGDKIRIVYGENGGDYVDATIGSEGEIEVDIPEADVYYAVYPVCEASLSGGVFTFTVPSSQSGKFSDAGFMTASATTDNRVFSFENASGLVKFEVKRSGVTRAVLRACDGTSIAGSADDGEKEISISIGGTGVYYATLLKNADLKAGIALRFFEGETALPGVLSLTALNASPGIIWNLGAPDERIFEGDYFISPDGTGIGKSADSPAGPALLQRLLGADTADGVAHSWRIGGKKIHLAVGTYAFNAESGYVVSTLSACDPVQIVADGEVTITSDGASAFTVAGGASFSFEGIKFSSCTTTESGAAMNWGSTGALVLKNCTFDGNVAAKAGGALYLSAGTADVSSCTFTGNKAAEGLGYNKDGGQPSGGAIYAIAPAGAEANTLLRIDHCFFDGNESGTYGAHLSLYTTSGDFRCIVWLNASSFKDGYASNGGVAKASSGERYYGKSIHADALKEVGQSEIAFNNCTVAGKRETPASDCKYNGMSLVSGENTRMMAVNSTFFGASNGTIFKNYNRNGTDTRNDEAYIFNCLLTNMTNTASVAKSSINLVNGTPVIKAGYNLFDDRKNAYVVADTDTPSIRYDQISWTWNDSDHLYEWSTEKEVTKFSTAAAADAFVNENLPSFDTWLKTIAANPYAVDQAGHARNSEKLNKGAWDAGL